MLALLCGAPTARAAAAQSGIAPGLRERALVTALRTRAAQVPDSALVDGCRVWVGDTTSHGEAMGMRLRDSLAGTQVRVRTCYDGYRDPHERPGSRATRLRLDGLARRGDTIDVVLQAARARERWRERLTMYVDAGGKVAGAVLRRESHARFPARPRFRAPGSAQDAALREAVVEAAVGHLWEDYGHLGDDTTAVYVGASGWQPSAERWLARVAKAYGVVGDTTRAPRRATVGFGPVAQSGDSATAEVYFSGGRRCPGTSTWIGSSTGYVYSFRRVRGEWRFVSRRAEGHGDSLDCPIVGRPH